MNNVKTAPVKKRKRSAASLDKRKARSGWLFVLPFLFGFLTVYLPIIAKSIYYSFTNFYPARNEFVFIKLENYQQALFKDTSFVTTLTEGLKQLVLDIPAIVIFSLFIAVILNQKMLGRAAFRAIFFIPVILATGLIDDVDAKNKSVTEVMGEQANVNGSGNSASDIISTIDIARLFESMKIGGALVEYVTSLVNDIYGIINRSGVQMLIFLSGLQSISPSIYESCQMEGATAWETFWKITFPMISPMILVNAFYTIIDSFTAESNEVMQAIINISPDGVPSGLQSAAAWTYFAVVIIALGLVALIASKFVFYNRKGE